MQAFKGSLFILFLVSVVAMAFGCAGGGSDGPAPVFDEQTKQLLQGSLDSSVSIIGVPGATMTVIRPDGAKWVGVCGLSDIEKSIPMAPGMKFRAGSLSKTFTATMILQLVQEGRLSLDQKLESILPGLVPNGPQISIRQLLNHTSGLFDYAQAENPNFLDGLAADPFREWTKEELIAIANNNHTTAAWTYSNTNYLILGMIMEKITGRTYAQEISSRILVPLGLHNTSVPDTPDMPPGSTRGYDYRGAAWVDVTRFGTSWAFGTGAIISTSEDLVVWLDALMKGTLLDRQRREEMFTFVDMGRQAGWQYGLGLEKQEFYAIGHTGDFVYGGQAAMYDFKGWRFIVLVNASPANDIGMFGSDYIMYRAMRTLGIW
jgi:D-alanyl-D-alanine carboxypeptidase